MIAGIFCLTTNSKAQNPSIISFAPNTGTVGTLVTIIGNNISNTNSLSIGGISAIKVSNKGDTVVAMVMPSTTVGAITVTTANGTATSVGNFTLASETKFYNEQQGPKLSSPTLTSQGNKVAISADGNTVAVSTKDGYQGIVVYIRNDGAWTQQGGIIGVGFRTTSLAMSANGNTMIAGGVDSSIGYVTYIFTRNNGVWTKQSKLIGNDPQAVSISADGNTAIVGGFDSVGNAAWIYTRNGNVWSNGNKLVGSGQTKGSYYTDTYFGYSVAISADGNTAIIGAPGDSSYFGAVWIYVRTGNNWLQQGHKLVGTGASSGFVSQGNSVAISADGNTVVFCGPSDSNGIGAFWTFVRMDSLWVQQGNKISGSTSGVGFGLCISLTADGNTVIVGAPTNYDALNNSIGFSLVYNKNNGVWAQRINGLLQGSDYVESYNDIKQGTAVGISADGTTAIEGGIGDAGNFDGPAGAAWVFKIIIPAANITSFIPSYASTGTRVQIIGKCFTGATGVSFGGVAASSFVVANDSIINAVVGGGSTGSVTVFGANGNGSLSGFTYVKPQSPTISSFAPSSGAIGTLVTINGLNVSNTTSIKIGGVVATIVSIDSAKVVAMVMPGATTGKISISTYGGSVISTNSFTITATKYPNYMLYDTTGSGIGSYPVISADGSTMIAGYGAQANIYVRKGRNWLYQSTLTPNNIDSFTTLREDGYIIPTAISADGNTAIFGQWIFYRNKGVWCQQSGIVHNNTDPIDPVYVFMPVFISADGNTAISSGYRDTTIFVYKRNGDSWFLRDSISFLGENLVPLSFSADGNTIVITDEGNLDGLRIIYYNGSKWVVQASKMLSKYTGVSLSDRGSSSLSADGNILSIAASGSSNGEIPVWIFVRKNGKWSENSKFFDYPLDSLYGGYYIDNVNIAMSSDGNTVIVSFSSAYSNGTIAYNRLGIGSTWQSKGLPASIYYRSPLGTSISANANTLICYGISDIVNEAITTYTSDSTLPIIFSAFTTEVINGIIQTNWYTSTELNTDHFIIQHGTDGTSFTDIGTVKAIGNGVNSYSFTDTHPTNSTNYYRLQSVDRDGASSFSKVVSAEIVDNKYEIVLVPNPVKSVAVIKGNHIASVQVVDNLGRVVKTVSLKDATNPTLSLVNLPAGAYHLRVQTTEGKVSGVGVVKE